MLSTRISILGLIIVLIIYVFQFQIKEKLSLTKSLLLLVMCFSFLLVYLTPNFQKRFYPKSQEGVDISDVDSRAVHWEGVIHRIGNENIFLGSGIIYYFGFYDIYVYRIDIRTP